MNQRRIILVLTIVLCTGLMLFGAFTYLVLPAQATEQETAQGNGQIWESRVESTQMMSLQRTPIPERYEIFDLNEAALETILSQAPSEFSSQVEGSTAVVPLPLPDGTYLDFRLAKSSSMVPEMAQKYPMIQSYSAQGVTDPTLTARLTWTPNGLYAAINDRSVVYMVAPYSFDEQVHHMSFLESDFVDQAAISPYDDLTDSHESGFSPLEAGYVSPALQESTVYSTGNVLRIYKAAIATTDEYGQANGGTIESVLSAVVSWLDWTNVVFERELAVRFVLAPNSDQVMYLGPGVTDPFTDTEDFNFDITQALYDAVIGSENYDVGHLFKANMAGGVAAGSVCNDSNKGRGEGNPGALRHEFGHMLGMPHSWNSTVCALSDAGGGNQYNAVGAFEIGSGNTIMSYFGLCGADNLPPPHTNRFHVGSYVDSVTRITENQTCGQWVDVDFNTAPTVDAGTNSITIPVDTPFTLEGSASDAEGDTMSFTWEQYDLGPSSYLTDLLGTSPRYMNYGETAEPIRTFPQLSDILANTTTLYEQPVTGPLTDTYTMTFRLRAYDNNAGLGGVAYDDVFVYITDTTTIGDPITPFLVTYPNAASVLWVGGTNENITWDVANTDQAPINCATVNIDLSLDGGYTYPTSLASGTANDGSHLVTIPAVDSGLARVRVACATHPDHFFFDVSDADFSVVSTVAPCVTSLVVSRLDNAGNCTLRDSIAFASPGDTVTFDASIAGSTIFLTQHLTITKNITVSAGGDITVSGSNLTRTFELNADVTLEGLIMTDGLVPGAGTGTPGGGAVKIIGSSVIISNSVVKDSAAWWGAGIMVGGNGDPPGTLILINSTVDNNHTSGNNAGGIYAYNGSSLTVIGSTISNNSADFGGGGISIRGPFTLTNSTVSGNFAPNRGAGILFANNNTDGNLINITLSDNQTNSSNGDIHIQNNSEVTFTNSIVANGLSGPNCSTETGGVANDNGNNIIEDNSCGFSGGVDPNLGPLQNNGGGTETHALLIGSPAINAGNNTVCVGSLVNGVDQRGVTRPFGATCDIGAYEYNVPPGPALVINKTVTPTGAITPGTMVTFTLSYSNVGDALATNVVITDELHSSFTPVSVSSSGAMISVIGATTYAWNVEDLSPGESGIITITGYTANNAYFFNTAIITGTGIVNTNNKSEPVPVLAVAEPRLVVDTADGIFDGDFSTGRNSIQEALEYAVDGDTITFHPSIAGSTIYLDEELFIFYDVDIDGGTNNITISGDTDNDGTGDVRVMRMNNVTSTITNLTIEFGFIASFGSGGGLLIQGDSNVTITGSTFLNNEAGFGGRSMMMATV